MISLVDDLSLLTSIKKYNLEELVNKCNMVISHAVVESIKQQETVTGIDIGIGILRVTNQEDELKFKFIPSAKLENTLIHTYNSKDSSLVAAVDAELGSRIQKTYKDLF